MIQVQEGDLYVCTAPAEFDHELLMEQVSTAMRHLSDNTRER